MAPKADVLEPHRDYRPVGIRKLYIQNLTDLLHVCLLRGEIERARRAWGILIRCREVNWKSRWQWGLELLSADQTQTSSLRSHVDVEGRDAERWLRGLRVSAREMEKPSLLHALVLHLIKHGRHRAALDELETYLSSYPYLLSGPLHTYAGMLAFYLAQPSSARSNVAVGTRQPSSETVDSPTSRHSAISSDGPMQREPPNVSLMRQARGWFIKAQGIDPDDEVALEFIRIIDHPNDSEEGSEDEHPEWEGKEEGMENRSDLEEGIDGVDGELDEDDNGSMSEDDDSDEERDYD